MYLKVSFGVGIEEHYLFILFIHVLFGLPFLTEMPTSRKPNCILLLSMTTKLLKPKCLKSVIKTKLENNKFKSKFCQDNTHCQTFKKSVSGI